MKLKQKVITPVRIWIGLFVCWFILLTGGVTSFTGSPGLLHVIRLRSLLEYRKIRLGQVQAEHQKLQAEASVLERSKYAQEREIRRILGYVADDELIFEFSGDR